MPTWRSIGVLSGTSLDGVDVAACALRPRGEVLELEPLGHTEIDYPDSLRTDLTSALPPAPVTAAQVCHLDTAVGQCFALAARRGVELAGGRADLVASLGQTLYHWVEQGTALGSLQLGQPAWIAETTGLPVIHDFRARDIAAGGQGAPLASVLDALWLADRAQVHAALNIGGIANLTVVDGDRLLAFDTGPGNALLDVAASWYTDAARDTGGELAARGHVRRDLLDRLHADPYLRRRPPKSTGKEHFNATYLRAALAELEKVAPSDLLATLTEFTAATIAEACEQHGVDVVVASGGGVRNPALVRALREHLGVHGRRLVRSDDLGLPASAKEAYLAALLGFLTLHGLPGTVQGGTGARGPRVLGSITPGAGPLHLPTPAEPPRRLRIGGLSED
ncbi:anhydro-N-acetylmuramic acid kinase [Bounagaea algeriensis]